MKQEFFNAMPDGTCRTIKANQAKVSAANLATQTARGATGVFVDLNYKEFKTTDIARCLKARYTAAPTNHACEDSGVLIGGDSDVTNKPKVIGGVGDKTFGKQYPQGNRVYDIDHVAPCLQANIGNASKGSMLIGGETIRIRRLTPREVWRLQGFPDEYFDKAKAAGISDSQLYKMAGNAVSVTVAKAIGLKLKEIENE